VTVNLGGSYGVWAREMAPYFYTARPNGPPILDFYEHRFHPWSVRGSLSVAVLESLVLSAEAAHTKTSYYDITHAGLSLLYRLPTGTLLH
jgi:hypothetical protein